MSREERVVVCVRVALPRDWLIKVWEAVVLVCYEM